MHFIELDKITSALGGVFFIYDNDRFPEQKPVSWCFRTPGAAFSYWETGPQAIYWFEETADAVKFLMFHEGVERWDPWRVF